jgi:hypothetical protein
MWYDADSAAEPADIALSRRVVASLHANADLLITADVARRAAASAGGMAERMGVEEWMTLLRSLVERGFRMDRTASFSSPEGHLGDAAAVMGVLLHDIGATRVELALGAQVYQLLMREEGAEALRMMADGLFFESGVYLPKPELLLDWDLGENEFRLRVNDCREVPQQGLAPDEILVDEHPDVLREQGFQGRACQNPYNRRSLTVLPSDYEHAFQEAGYTTWDAGGYVVLMMAQMLRERLGALLTPAVAELALTQ